MISLYDYQASGVGRVDAEHARGVERILAVAPTGAGKGTMAAWLLERASQQGLTGLFIVHRREIVRDVAKRLRALGVAVKVHLAGERSDGGARVHVAMVQTLIARGLPDADLIVVDEAHHYQADEWRAVIDSYANTLMIGFTATPQRADGRAMGDVFQSIVEVARYSELLEARRIVPCTVLRPPTGLGIDLAQDPLDAYVKYANGSCALVYVRRIAEANELRQRFVAAGIVTEVVHGKTGKSKRDETLRRLADGRVTVVINVYALTEGVDVPRVSTIVLARTCQHASTYVQIVGRALRALEGKTSALLLDLTGVSHKHGLPTDDRAYSLEGSGMGEGVPREVEQGDREERVPKVVGLELQAVGAARVVEALPDPRRLRWDLLAAEIEAGRMRVKQAVDAYRAEFGDRPPWVALLPVPVKRREWQRLAGLAAEQSMPPAYADAAYRNLFSEQPPRGQ